MAWLALKMLFGDKGKFIGMVAGVFFAALVITQQSSIFTGLMTRTFRFVDDVGVADIWVMDPKVQFIDDIKPLQDTALNRVRGVPGVDWAMPLYRGLIKARLSNGNFQNCNVIGIDDSTLIGGPGLMLEGKLSSLRQADGVIVDVVGASTRLAARSKDPSVPPMPLKVGDTLELNDKRAIVVGIAKVSRTFQSQPVIYTTFSRAVQFAPRERRLLSFVIVKVKPAESPKELAAKIKDATGLAAYTEDEFKELTLNFYLKNTGIPINFGIAIVLAFIVGTAIAGQTFYSFTSENLKYFATLRAMGAGSLVLVGMVVLQALVVGFLGYGMGVGAASMFYYISLNSELAFRLRWEILAITGSAISLICLIAALLSIRKVLTLEPASVFKS